MPDPSLNDKSLLYREGPAITLLLFALLLLYLPVIFGNKTVFSRDTALFNFPMYHFLYHAFHEGFIPFWEPKQFTGLPFMAVLQSSVFYPPSLIFFLDDFVFAFNLSLVLHHAILVFGIYALMRFWGFSPTAALCSGLTALIGGFFLSLSTFTNHFNSAAWLPWFLLFFEKFLREKSVRYFLISISICVLQTLAGSPEFSILSVLIIFFHSLILRRGDSGGSVLTLSLWTGGVVIFSLALTAFQLLPTYLFSLTTTRELGLDYANHARWSFDPATLLTLLFSMTSEGFELSKTQSGGNFFSTVYMGILSAFGLAGALVFFKTSRSIRFWWCAFWVGIFFALGEFNPLYSYFYEWMPLLKNFRFPEKFFFISAFSMTFLTGMVVDSLLKARTPDPARIKKMLWILLAVLITSGALYGLQPEAKSYYPLIFLALFGLICFLLFRNRMAPALFGGITLFIIALDLFTHNMIHIPLADRKLFDEVPPVVNVLNQDPGNFRIFSERYIPEYSGDPATPPDEIGSMRFTHEDRKNILEGPLGSYYGLQTIQGSLGVETLEQGLFNNILFHTPWSETPGLLARFNVKYVITTHQWQKGSDGVRVDPKARILKLETLPRAFLVSAALTMDPKLIPRAYLSSEFNPRERVLISEPVDSASDSGFQGEVTEIRYQPNGVKIQTRQKGNGYLVLLDPYYPGWHATVDGREVEILRGNHFFRTLPLSDGDHQIIFYYEQEGFQTGLTISGITLLLLIAGCAWRQRDAGPNRAKARS